MLRSMECYRVAGRSRWHGRSTEVKHMAWYSHGSPALQRSHCGQFHLPDRNKKTGDELFNRDTATFPLGPSFLLLSLHPNGWDTPTPRSRARREAGNVAASVPAERPNMGKLSGQTQDTLPKTVTTEGIWWIR